MKTVRLLSSTWSKSALGPALEIESPKFTHLNSHTYSKDSIISTVSIKRTVLKFSLMTLLKVPYNLNMAFKRFNCTVSIKRTVSVNTLLYILFTYLKSMIFIPQRDKYEHLRF